MGTENTSIIATGPSHKRDQSYRATEDKMESPRKRRKLSGDGQVDFPLNHGSFTEIPERESHNDRNRGESSKEHVATTPKNLAEQNVAPFLAKHIRDQHAPMNSFEPAGEQQRSAFDVNRNSKYCYRHRPDLKCRRQADEITMAKMQQVCSLVLFYSRKGGP